MARSLITGALSFCCVQLQKRKEIAQSLREMNRENVAKLALREKQKLKDAEEDKRLMKEYQERLDRQEREGCLPGVRLGKRSCCLHASHY